MGFFSTQNLPYAPPDTTRPHDRSLQTTYDEGQCVVNIVYVEDEGGGKEE